MFWYSNRSGNNDIWCRRYNQSTGFWGGDTQLTTSTDADFNPTALIDSSGDVWVFWYSLAGGNYDINYKRFTSDSGWGNSVRLTTVADIDFSPVAVEGPEGDIWVFWSRYTTDVTSSWIMNRSLVPSI